VHLFPVFLRLQGKRCVVVGAGSVGLAKAEALAQAGALVTVIDAEPCANLRALAARADNVRILARNFQKHDTRGALLVFACTSSPEAQAEIESDAHAGGALLCRADDAEAGDFSSAAVLRRGTLCVAVSSGGASPALAARARDAVAETVGEEYGRAAELLAHMRTLLRATPSSQAQRATALRSVLERGLVQLLREGRSAEAEALVAEAATRAAAEPLDDGQSATTRETMSEVDPCTA